MVGPQRRVNYSDDMASANGSSERGLPVLSPIWSHLPTGMDI